jgi:hypothetical protein
MTGRKESNELSRLKLEGRARALSWNLTVRP